MIKQRYSSWGSWPADVEPRLLIWNKAHLLSFLRGPNFQCGGGCGRMIETHPNGNAVIRDTPKAHGTTICEDCLIAFARNFDTPPAIGYRGAIIKQNQHIVALQHYIANLERKNERLRRQIESDSAYIEMLEPEIIPDVLNVIRHTLRGKYRRSE